MNNQDTTIIWLRQAIARHGRGATCAAIRSQIESYEFNHRRACWENDVEAALDCEREMVALNDMLAIAKDMQPACV